jgi:inorganic triphosphatase YgiF
VNDTKQRSCHARDDAIDRTPTAPPQDEFELKLDVASTGIATLLGTAPFNRLDAEDRQQHSVYFDTPDLELRKAGFSLRIRSIGDRRIQTVKACSAAAAGLFVRPEWECDIDGDTPVLSGGETPLQGLIPDAALAQVEPVFRVQVVRRTVLVERDDALVEVVLDRGEVIAKDRSAAIHELELELKTGHPAALFALAREFDALAPVRLGVLSKSDRGYRLGRSAAAKPVKTAPLVLDPATTAKHGLQAIAGACLRQFRLNEAILIDTGEAGALHQARVSLRRLRSALSTFRTIVQDDRFDDLRAELRWIAGMLGEARNIDVLLEKLPGKTAAKPLEEARERAYADVQAALRSDRLRRLMLDLSEWLAIGSWTTDPDRADTRDQPLADFAAKALGKHRRRLKRLGRGMATISDEKRHEARIEAKKLRYATEFFGSLFTSDTSVKRRRSFHKRLAALQSHLGDLNDMATAPIVLAELGLVGTETEAALQPDLSRRGSLIKKAAKAHEALVTGKRFWQ